MSAALRGPDALGQRGINAWEDIAREHALARVRLGFTSAIANVLQNAVKYTDAGEVRVGAEAGADRVTVHVWDNCAGLSQEELRVIFEPFERGRTKKPGSGLGLAIARRALEAQGGSIGAESPGERGCHFWLTLPRALHRREKAEADPCPESSL